MRRSLFFTVLLCTSLAYGVVFEVEVLPIISGTTFYVSEESQHGIINSTVYWENTGSTTCSHALRLDVYKTPKSNLTFNGKFVDSLDKENQRKLHAIVWSDEVEILHGESAYLTAVWATEHNKTRTYTVQPRIFACGEYNYLEVKEQMVSWNNETQELDDTLTMTLYLNEKILEVKSNIALNETYIFPTNKNPEIKLPLFIHIDRLEPGKNILIDFSYSGEERALRNVPFEIIADEGQKRVKQKITRIENEKFIERLWLRTRLFFQNR